MSTSASHWHCGRLPGYSTWVNLRLQRTKHLHTWCRSRHSLKKSWTLSYKCRRVAPTENSMRNISTCRLLAWSAILFLLSQLYWLVLTAKMHPHLPSLVAHPCRDFLRLAQRVAEHLNAAHKHPPGVVHLRKCSVCVPRGWQDERDRCMEEEYMGREYARVRAIFMPLTSNIQVTFGQVWDYSASPAQQEKGVLRSVAKYGSVEGNHTWRWNIREWAWCVWAWLGTRILGRELRGAGEVEEEMIRVFSLLFLPFTNDWLMIRSIYWIVGGVVSAFNLPLGRALILCTGLVDWKGPSDPRYHCYF